MTLRELQNNLQVDNSRLRTSVSAMVATGELSMRNGTYAPGFATYVNANAPETIPCTLVKLAARCFGFASRDDGEGDIFIPGRALHGAMPQDKNQRQAVSTIPAWRAPLRVRSSKSPCLTTALPVRSACLRMAAWPLSRTAARDVKFLLAKQGSEGVHLGDKVGFLITHRGNRHSDHRAAVVEKFGSSDYASECAKAILYGRNVRLEFPPEVLEEAHAYDDATIDPTEAAKRLDLRGIPIFTIDSAETKDIDDAISLQKLDDGYELGVHIADVSHYVRPGSALDEEAFERATSIYYADKVIPMLPTQLSNGICSLNEGEDRLAFSCLMRLDENGEIRSYKFVKSVICSRVKGVYKEINALLEPEEGADLTDLQTKYAAVLDQLPVMDELYRKRLVLRKARGGMDIESNEAKLVMDENGRCVDIVKRDRGTSECMIEEFMLLANQCAANAGRTNKVPFVYRVHEAPDAEKMEKLSATLLACGLNAKFKNPIPTQLELAALLDETRDQPIQILCTPVSCAVCRRPATPRSPGPLRPGAGGLRPLYQPHPPLPGFGHPSHSERNAHGASASSCRRTLMNLPSRPARSPASRKSLPCASNATLRICTRPSICTAIWARSTPARWRASPARRFCRAGQYGRGLCARRPALQGRAAGHRRREYAGPLTGKSWMLGSSMKIQVAAADVALGRIDFEYMVE